MFDGKKLEMTIGISNQKKVAEFIQIEQNNLVFQLSNAQADTQLIKNTTHLFFPTAFVVYYKNDSIIDDIVYRTDHHLPNAIGLMIPADSTVEINYSNQFIGNLTRDTLNKKEELYVEMYLIYKCNGKLTYAKTKKTKVLYE